VLDLSQICSVRATHPPVDHIVRAHGARTGVGTRPAQTNVLTAPRTNSFSRGPVTISHETANMATAARSLCDRRRTVSVRDPAVEQVVRERSQPVADL